MRRVRALGLGLAVRRSPTTRHRISRCPLSSCPPAPSPPRAPGGQACEVAQARASDLEAQLEQQQALVSQLEEDLVAARSAGAGAGPGAGAAGANGAAAGAGGAADGAGMGVGDAALARALAARGEEGGGEASIVRVLSAQRDRFRARCQELEESISKANVQLEVRVAATVSSVCD
jgi:homeobox protein cut-like